MVPGSAAVNRDVVPALLTPKEVVLARDQLDDVEVRKGHHIPGGIAKALYAAKLHPMGATPRSVGVRGFARGGVSGGQTGDVQMGLPPPEFGPPGPGNEFPPQPVDQYGYPINPGPGGPTVTIGGTPGPGDDPTGNEPPGGTIGVTPPGTTGTHIGPTSTPPPATGPSGTSLDAPHFGWTSGSGLNSSRFGVGDNLRSIRADLANPFGTPTGPPVGINPALWATIRKYGGMGGKGPLSFSGGGAVPEPRDSISHDADSVMGNELELSKMPFTYIDGRRVLLPLGPKGPQIFINEEPGAENHGTIPEIKIQPRRPLAKEYLRV